MVRWLVVVFVACGSAAAAPTIDPSIGWWRSDTLCLELFANGDFQLSVMEPGTAKIQVLGHAKLAGTTLALDVQRIWAGRWVSACRKTHIPGHWADDTTALGTTFTPKQTSKLTFKRDGDKLELCATACATLHRETPALVGRWRRDGLDSPDSPTKPWTTGEPLELDLHGANLSHVWIGTSDKKYDEVSGDGAATYVEPDRFTVTVDKRTLTAKRLADEKLEVCEAKHCAVLVRQFDEYHYDLD
jgi:hypothetical protein